jgi:hypothetical protein
MRTLNGRKQNQFIVLFRDQAPAQMCGHVGRLRSCQLWFSMSISRRSTYGGQVQHRRAASSSGLSQAQHRCAGLMVVLGQAQHRTGRRLGRTLLSSHVLG